MGRERQTGVKLECVLTIGINSTCRLLLPSFLLISFFNPEYAGSTFILGFYGTKQCYIPENSTLRKPTAMKTSYSTTNMNRGILGDLRILHTKNNLKTSVG
jgi:hypothetical protein